MFGADIAYMDSCVGEDYAGSSVLPEYLYPAFRLPNPWQQQGTSSHLDIDVIIIAEFSELEGPKPVITIPNDRDLHFNINDFTVRIMSVDQGSSGQQGFSMPEDLQVMMSDTKENVYAFVHHFVLLDKQARGYSRPFAISYVTPDQRKLLNFNEEISSNFKKIARYLKYGNKLVFKNDLDKFMMDLQYTKDQIVNRYRTKIQPGQMDHDNKLLQSLKILESQSAEIQAVLSQLNPTLNDKKMEQRFLKIEERAQANKNKPKPTESSSLGEWDSIDTPETQIHFASLGSITDMENLLFFDSHNYKPKLVEVTKGRKFDLHLRGLHELCSWGAKEGLQKLRHIYQYFKQDIAVLQMEKRDLSLLDPPSGLMTFGNQFIAANMMKDIDKLCISSCCFMVVPGSRASMESWNVLGKSWGSTDTLSSFKSLPSSYQSFMDDDSDSDSMMSATSDLGVYLQRTSSLGSFQLVGSFDSIRNSFTPPQLSSDKTKSPEDDSMFYTDSPKESTLVENLNDDTTEGVKDCEVVSEKVEGHKEMSKDVEGCKEMSEKVKGCEIMSEEVEGCKEKSEKIDGLKEMSEKVEGHKVMSEEGEGHMSEKVEDCYEDPILDDLEETLTDKNACDINDFKNSNSNVLSENNEDKNRNQEENSDTQSNVTVLDNYMSLKTAFVDSVNVIEGDLEIVDERDRSTTVVFNQNREEVKTTNRNIMSDSDICNNNLGNSENENDCLESVVNEILDELASNPNVKSSGNLGGRLDNDSLLASFEDSDDSSTELKRERNGTITCDNAIESLGDKISNRQFKCEDCSYRDTDTSSGISSCSGYQSKLTQTTQSDDSNENSSRRGSRTELGQSVPTDIFRFSSDFDTTYAGFGISTVLLNYHNIQNVIYSLLTGRTVVVIGSAQFEEEIRGVVRALKLFLPGCHSHQNSCIPWCYKGLTTKDLIDVKLIGICRHEKKSVDRMLPKAVQKYITLVDVERRMLVSPVYQGSLVTTVLSRKKSFKTEECYVDFIKVSLCDFASKAFIYFHSFCLGPAGSGISDPSSVLLDSDTVKKTSSAFLSKLGILDSDRHILEYITDVIKYQHIEDHCKSIGYSGVPSRPVVKRMQPASNQRL